MLAVGAFLSMASGTDEGFQKLLLRIASKPGQRPTTSELIQFFCTATREFFDVSGVYFWRCSAGDELVGEQADGKMAQRFVGLRLRPLESTVTAEAVRQRRTIFANHAWITKNRPDLANRLVFITGDIANEETIATLRETGAPCVEKPFRVQQFIDVISRTFGKAE